MIDLAASALQACDSLIWSGSMNIRVRLRDSGLPDRGTVE